jgi:hypothetical protein
VRAFFLRLPADLPEDRLMRILRARGNGDSCCLCYLFMLSESAASAGRLALSEGRPYTAETLGAVVGFPEGTVEDTLRVCEEFGAVSAKDDGILVFAAAADGSVCSEAESTLRSRKSRLLKKQWAGGAASAEGRGASCCRTVASQRRCDGDATAAEDPRPQHGVSSSVSASFPDPDADTDTDTSCPSAPSESPVGGPKPAAVGASALPEDRRKLADGFIARYPKKQPYRSGRVYAFFLAEGMTPEKTASALSYLGICMASPVWRDRIERDPSLGFLPSADRFLEQWKALPAGQGASGGRRPDSFAEEVRRDPIRGIADEALLDAEGKGFLDDDSEAELARRRAEGKIPPRDPPEESEKAKAPTPIGKPDLEGLAKSKSVDVILSEADSKAAAKAR